jgi:hypothetical protein
MSVSKDYGKESTDKFFTEENTIHELQLPSHHNPKIRKGTPQFPGYQSIHQPGPESCHY